MLLERASLFLTPVPVTTPDQWARSRIYPDTAGVPGARNPDLTKYMVPLGRAAVSGKYKRVVGVTSAQSGKTDTVLDIIGQKLDQKPAPLLYVGPSKEFNTDQFEPRLVEMFDQVATLSRKVSRSKRSKKTLKFVAGVRVRLAHAGSSTALKSDPAAMAFVDEYDEMRANLKGQGDPLGLVEARGETYADFVTVITSTPGRGFAETEIDAVSGLEFWKVGDPEEIDSPIWLLWQEGTRHHFAWPCPHCNEYFVPMQKHLAWEGKDRNVGSPADASRTAYLQCPYGCADPILDHLHKEDMTERGVMIAPGQTIEDAFADTNVPDTSTYSQWSSGLCSPFKTWGDRAEQILTAIYSGELDKRQTATNAYFGELFIPIGGDVPEWEEVRRLKLPYAEHTVPAGVLAVTCGVDVQKNRLVYVVRGWGKRQESWLITKGEIWGATADDTVWTQLFEDVLSARYGGMHIMRTFVDAGFRPGKKDVVPEHKVYEFARRHGRTVYATKGFDTRPTPLSVNRIDVKASGSRAKYGLDLVRLSTDFFKSWVHERLRWPEDQQGGWHLFETIDEDYCRQIVSEARAKKPKGGGSTWIVKSKNNHFLDCEALSFAAAYMLGIQRVRDDAASPQATRPQSAPQSVAAAERKPVELPPAQPAAKPPTRKREGYLSGGGTRPGGGFLGGR